MPQLTPIQARNGQPFGSPVEAHSAAQVDASAHAGGGLAGKFARQVLIGIRWHHDV